MGRGGSGGDKIYHQPIYPPLSFCQHYLSNFLLQAADFTAELGEAGLQLWDLTGP